MNRRDLLKLILAGVAALLGIKAIAKPERSDLSQWAELASNPRVGPQGGFLIPKHLQGKIFQNADGQIRLSNDWPAVVARYQATGSTKPINLDDPYPIDEHGVQLT